MGTIQHHAIIVTAPDEYEKLLKEAQELAFSLFGYQMTTVRCPAVANGYQTFFVSPDGSKEGWDTSNEFDEKREILVGFLRQENIQFVEVTYGELGVWIVRSSYAETETRS